MAMIILLVLLIFFAVLGVPLAFAIGASCVTYISTNAPTFMSMVPQRIWNGAYSELMIAMPLFIIVCVSFGVCTASESAGVAVLYSLLVGFFVYRELTWKAVLEALKKTLISSSSIMIIIGFTIIFTWVLTMQKVPQIVAGFFMGLNMPAWGIVLVFCVMILMIGTFIDASPAILLLTPIMLPVMQNYGFSALQFGAMMITGLAIGW